MPRLFLHGIQPQCTPISRLLCRLEGTRLTDGAAVLVEYTGTFWRNGDGNFTSIELQEVHLLSVESASGRREMGAEHELRIAGNCLWDHQQCIAMLRDSCWIECESGEPLSAIVMQE